MKYQSRKFIDLVVKASAKWPTLEPFAKHIEVGDYGKIDEETGEFQYHGNIYRNSEVLACFPALNTEAYKPHCSDEIEKWIITTEKTKQVDNTAKPSLAGSDIEPALEVQFSFKAGSRGAFIAMYRPKSMYLPKDILLHKLHNIPMLKDLFLITSVVSCPAYALYLSDKNADNIRVAFVANNPAPSALSLPGYSNQKLGWISDRKAGFYQEGFDPEGTHKYRPLFTLKRMANNNGSWWNLFRDNPPTEAEAAQLWRDHTDTPWEPLNEDGEMDDFADDIDCA